MKNKQIAELEYQPILLPTIPMGRFSQGVWNEKFSQLPYPTAEGQAQTHLIDLKKADGRVASITAAAVLQKLFLILKPNAQVIGIGAVRRALTGIFDSEKQK